MVREFQMNSHIIEQWFTLKFSLRKFQKIFKIFLIINFGTGEAYRKIAWR